VTIQVVRKREWSEFAEPFDLALRGAVADPEIMEI
jgi:hypothetical protein